MREICLNSVEENLKKMIKYIIKYLMIKDQMMVFNYIVNIILLAE